MRGAIRMVIAAAPAALILLPPAMAGALSGSSTPGSSSRPASGDRQTIVVQLDRTASESSVFGATAKPRALPHSRYSLVVLTAQLPATLALLLSQPGVRYASVAKPVHASASSSPNDTCYVGACAGFDPQGGVVGPVSDAPPLNLVGAPAAWGVTHGDGIRIAVLDTGVATTNPDLAGKIVGVTNICVAGSIYCSTDPALLTPAQQATFNSYCQPASGASADDLDGHGTHVSGIAAADTGNGAGVASLGWGALLDEYKVLDCQGSGNTADVASAIYDAVAAGDRVINMSFANFSCPAVNNDTSQCGPDQDEQTAVEYALAHNVVVVAAAGNDGFNAPTYPASYSGVLSVAATDSAGVVQPFSQWGSAANIAAPGLDIISTWNGAGRCGDYCVDTGTSMASPDVAAAAALMIANDPALSGPQVTNLLLTSASPTAGGNPITGGVLDVPAALQAEAGPPPTRYPGYDMVGSDGSVYTFGQSVYAGSRAGQPLAKPVVGMARRPDGLGYWLVASDGGIFTFGSAPFLGSMGGKPLNRPVVGMAATPDGRGYWLVASDGGIFTFGDAGFYGSMGGKPLNAPVVAAVSSPDGRGYSLIASDGGVFTFGDAGFYGSEGGHRLPAPVVGAA